MLALLLILIGVILMALAGVGVTGGRANLTVLGFAALAAGVWLVPPPGRRRSGARF